MYRHMLKRGLDIVLALLALLFLFPLMLMIAITIYWTMGRPIFFRQARPGLGGQIFTLLKFRTMINQRNVNEKVLSDAERLTSFGDFLRRTSLDELPEFLNVLAGDMSIVGPRPLFTHYLERYTPTQARRHEVQPGLTGWAQINGRNAISWEKKFELDVWYVDHMSFGLDLYILLLTPYKVLSREGISHENEATMSEFMGRQ
jgi:sugar transferase EpsL